MGLWVGSSVSRVIGRQVGTIKQTDLLIRASCLSFSLIPCYFRYLVSSLAVDTGCRTFRMFFVLPLSLVPCNLRHWDTLQDGRRFQVVIALSFLLMPRNFRNLGSS